jgi:hypothetical protein
VIIYAGMRPIQAPKLAPRGVSREIVEEVVSRRRQWNRLALVYFSMALVVSFQPSSLLLRAHPPRFTFITNTTFRQPLRGK